MENMDAWNVLKKQLNTSTRSSKLFRAQEIWWCNVGLNVGYEVYGKGPTFTRPVLIFKKKSHDTFIGIPMSTRLKNRTDYHIIEFHGKQSALMLGEIRNFDARRLADRMGKLADTKFTRIEKAVIEYLQPRINS
jgi:mRNA interferase MazF